MESDIKGRMLEDIIYYQLVKDKEIADRHNIFKYKTIVNTKDIERHKEIAIVIMSKKTNNSFWLEVNYSKDVGKIILYRGENLSISDESISVNASEFLLNMHKYLNDDIPDTFSITKDNNFCFPLYQKILAAVDAVTEVENESAEFKAKLLQDTLKTEEYQNVLKILQSKADEYTK